MNISENGLALIKRFEGCRLAAYKCPAGVWTIGYGSTGPHVKPSSKITQAEADALLLHDLIRFEDTVRQSVKRPTQGQFDALVSFAFNLGSQRLLDSTLLRLHNSGRIAEAADQFRLWTKGGGRVLPGLVARREAERKLYLS